MNNVIALLQTSLPHVKQPVVVGVGIAYFAVIIAISVAILLAMSAYVISL